MTITGLTDDLQAEGLVERAAAPGDRRSFRVLLTPAGRQTFERMAGDHEAWIIELFGGPSATDQHSLSEALARLRTQLLARRTAPTKPALN